MSYQGPFKVWVVIEQWDGDDWREEGDLCFASTALLANYDDALALSDLMNSAGERIAFEQGYERAQDPEGA